MIDRIPFVAVHPPFMGQIHGLTKMISYLSTSTKKKQFVKQMQIAKLKRFVDVKILIKVISLNVYVNQ